MRITSNNNDVNFKARLKINNYGNWSIKSKEWTKSRQLASQLKGDVLVFHIGPKSSTVDTRSPLSEARIESYDTILQSDNKGKLGLQFNTVSRHDLSLSDEPFHPVKFLEAKLQELLDRQNSGKKK